MIEPLFGSYLYGNPLIGTSPEKRASMPRLKVPETIELSLGMKFTLMVT